jgi:hypothetical protein
VTLKQRLRVLVVCIGLEVGVLSGVAVRPEEIRDLMHQMNQPKIAHVLPAADDEGGGKAPNDPAAEGD